MGGGGDGEVGAGRGHGSGQGDGGDDPGWSHDGSPRSATLDGSWPQLGLGWSRADDGRASRPARTGLAAVAIMNRNERTDATQGSCNRLVRVNVPRRPRAGTVGRSRHTRWGPAQGPSGPPGFADHRHTSRPGRCETGPARPGWLVRCDATAPALTRTAARSVAWSLTCQRPAAKWPRLSRRLRGSLPEATTMTTWGTSGWWLRMAVQACSRAATRRLAAAWSTDGVAACQARQGLQAVDRGYRSWRGDSNPQPAVYKTAALPVAPRQRGC